MSIAISWTQDSNRKSLQMWAAYIAGETRTKPDTRPAELAAPPEMPPSTMPRVRMKSSAQSATLHSPGCVCSLCSAPPMSNSGVSTVSARVVQINLNGELSDEDKKVLEYLRKRDMEVRRHEQAHLVAAGPYAMGAPSYTYQVGPDGQRYAVGGQVQIDLSEEMTPEETLRKAQRLQQAALAPADPSSADRQVAAMASQMAQQALREIAEERMERQREAPAPEAPAPAEIPGAQEAEDAPGISAARLTDPAGQSEISATPATGDTSAAPMQPSSSIPSMPVQLEQPGLDAVDLYI